MEGFKCNKCEKYLKSATGLRYHTKERHTFKNCVKKECNVCFETFHSPTHKTKGKPDFTFTQCEKCRDLQTSLNTIGIFFGKYVYNNGKQFLIEKGFATEVCKLYTCREKECKKHLDVETTLCNSPTCHRIFEKGKYNACCECKKRNSTGVSKGKEIVRELKTKLGGICTNCKETDISKLEFACIDKTIRVRTISRLNPRNCNIDLSNTKLLCKQCRIISTKKIQNKPNKVVIEKKSLVKKVKQSDSMEFICSVCQRKCTSSGNLHSHKREMHNHENCIESKCIMCDKMFYSPSCNRRERCEKCRDLQVSLNTSNMIVGKYVYNDSKRYLIGKGFVTETCKIYTCNKERECEEHLGIEIITCQSSKCKNMFSKTGYNFCEKCRYTNIVAKNKFRKALMELKIKLGGVCVMCNTSELFKLEFDHIDPTKKTKQITRMAPDKWEAEITTNIQLLCGNCHRIKSFDERPDIIIDTNVKKVKYRNKLIVQKIKREIGGCEICKWSHQDDEVMSCVLDFDHIDTETKYKQVSNLYNCKKEIILEEIKKCRLLCRCCHQLNTCIQRGGRMLDIYYTKEEVEILKESVK